MDWSSLKAFSRGEVCALPVAILLCQLGHFVGDLCKVLDVCLEEIVQSQELPDLADSGWGHAIPDRLELVGDVFDSVLGESKSQVGNIV